MISTIIIKVMANLYYLFIPISMVTTVAFDKKYEKYKREKGYKNKYKGTYKTKGLFSGDKIDIVGTIADLGVTFLIPGYQIEPIVELFLFKDQARVTLHKEEDSKDIEAVDPNIIDVDCTVINEENVETQENSVNGEEKEFSMEALAMHAASHMENPDFYDEDTKEYAEALEAYKELYAYYMEEMNKQNQSQIAPYDEKREPRLK